MSLGKCRIGSLGLDRSCFNFSFVLSIRKGPLINCRIFSVGGGVERKFVISSSMCINGACQCRGNYLIEEVVSDL